MLYHVYILSRRKEALGPGNKCRDDSLGSGKGEPIVII
jgi:hypothetical protein